ncbi:MAG: hypothetical protein AB7I68_00250 [Porticoccaceae bacterium]
MTTACIPSQLQFHALGSREVVGKAEYLPNKANPRFVVTNLPIGRADARQDSDGPPRVLQQPQQRP